MITKSDYNKAKKIVDQYNKEQNDYSGYAKITCEGSFVAKVLKTDLHDWIDKFLAKKLKNKPGKYSERMWDKLNEYEVHVDGESYILVSYDDKLSDKWLGSGLNITIKTWPDKYQGKVAQRILENPEANQEILSENIKK